MPWLIRKKVNDLASFWEFDLNRISSRFGWSQEFYVQLGATTGDSHVTTHLRQAGREAPVSSHWVQPDLFRVWASEPLVSNSSHSSTQRRFLKNSSFDSFVASDSKLPEAGGGTSMARGILLESQGNCLLCLFTLFFHVFFFPKTGRCCWFHSQVDPRGGPQFFEQQTSLRDGCFRGERFVSKRREMSWKDMKRHPIAVVFFTWNVVVRCSKGMSVEKSFSKKLIQLSYDPWMTSMLSGASHGSTHATGALRHVVWLSDVLLAQLTIRWKKHLEWLGDWSWLYRYFFHLAFST